MADPAFVLSNCLSLLVKPFLLALQGGCLIPVAHSHDSTNNPDLEGPIGTRVPCGIMIVLQKPGTGYFPEHFLPVWKSRSQ